TNGRELWKSDGTETGTVLIEDINPGEADSNPDKLTDVNGTAFFTADNGTNGTELWKSDGTQTGTVLVKDIIPGSEGSNADNLTNVNGTLFFTVDDGANGNELWKSNGTAEGTVLVKDINPGTNSNPDNLTNFDGILYFTADDGTNGTELWKSDGTAEGTVLVDDINPGSTSSNPDDLTVVNGELYFSADDGVNGRELWGLTEAEGNDNNIFGVKDGNSSEFDNVPPKPNQVTIVPTQTGDIELPSKFNAKNFESIVAIDGANGTGGASVGGADFPAGSAVLRDGEEGSNNKWNFSQIELRNIAYINGRDGNDKIVGSEGADKILGGAGNDNLRGKEGDDTIEGGIGNDVILGNGGSDILNGQQGNDVLTGGGGSDKFVLSNDFGNDVITDFTLGKDEIINTTESIVLAVASVGDAINVAFSNTGDLLQVNLNGNDLAGLENYLLTLGSDLLAD
ncbi:MAG: ELWxxDGT repeat protein, partial [Rivularia sp. (in: cyanobacteria)]